MNRTDNNPPKIDQHLLDLLVDGELDEPGRRELLARLDDTEDGWRRCALAFLENQCLGTELGHLARVSPAEASRKKRTGRSSFFGRHRGTLAAMAASFLVALALGISWRSLFLSDAGIVSPSMDVADLEAPASPDVSDGFPDTPQIVSSDSADGPEEDPGAWRMVSFAMPNGSNEAETIRLPAIERDTLDEVWLDELPQAIPPEVIRTIEDSGARIRGQRRLLPLRMTDGRRLVVPVDQVEIQYVGAPAYH